MRNYSNLLKAALAALVLSPGIASAQMLLFFALPDDATLLTAEEIYEIYGNRTENWGEGSFAFRGADGTYRAVNSGERSVASGRWYITTDGKKCDQARWHWPQDFKVKSKKQLSCERFARDANGRVWSKNVTTNSAWSRVNRDDMSRGDYSLGIYNEVVRELELDG